jgi:long-chain acyl-CoA synthetase
LRKNKITSVALVPQVLQLLINGIENEVQKEHKQKIWTFLNNLSSNLPFFVRRLLFRSVLNKIGPNLLFFGCGSAPLNLKLAQKWENLGIEIFEGYGATETTAVLTINTPKAKKLGSVGKALPGIKLRIDTDVRSQPTPDVKRVRTSGYDGEVLAKGPNISPGYFEDEEKTEAAFKNDWYHTGDVGELDSDGFLYITGRVAFRIVLLNGQKVYPEDIEKKLNAHPLVAESCVVGVKKEEGEVVHAVVITKYPKDLSKIIKDTNQNLASHEQIMEVSLWQKEDFPRTPILKIDRKRIAETLRGVGVTKEPVKIDVYDKVINLISQVAKIASTEIKENSTLATDLKLDSLQRVELLSLIEQDFAVAIPEASINPQTTVEILRRLIQESPTESPEIPINQWNYNPMFAKIRTILQNVFAFPIHSLFVPLKVIGEENLRNIKLPAIFYFNHIGIMDGLCVLRMLPKTVREKLVIAVNADIWQDYRKNWVQFLGGGFPFDKKKRIKASLELTGEFLDKGFSVLLAPEGTFSKDGRLMEFKPGIGFMAVEMQVGVVPIKIDTKYREIFPPMGGTFLENLPKKRKKIWIKIGKPMNFSKGIPYEEATQKMHQALVTL